MAVRGIAGSGTAGAGTAGAGKIGAGAGAGAGRAGAVPADAGADDACVTRTEARTRLGLEAGEFRSALELGEIRAVVGDGPRGGAGWTPRIPLSEVDRLLADPGFPGGLRRRIADAGAREAAALLGVTAHRFGRLARAGWVRPVRWYVNRYRAVVWRYLVTDLIALVVASGAGSGVHDRTGAAEAAHRARGTGDDGGAGWAIVPGGAGGAAVRRGVGGPAGLRPPGRLPDLGDTDLRGRGWRARRVGQLLRDAHDPWWRAAVWAALAGGPGPGAVPADEAAYLRRLLPSLHGGGAGWRAAPEVMHSLCTAQDGDETATAGRELASALRLARSVRSAPLLVPAAEAARVLGCPSAALPRGYTGEDAAVPRDVLDRWILAPPPWLRSAALR